MNRLKLKIHKLLRDTPKLVLALGAVMVIGGGAAIATIGIGGSMFGGGSVNLQDGLIGHWKLDGNTNDATIYNNHGTVNGDGGGVVLGEAGKFTSPEDAGWKTVEFANSYTTPVVVGTNNTHNGEAALVFESRNVTNNSAEMRLCESEGSTTGCDTHASETAGYMVIDAAETDSVAGIEAGTFDIDSGLDTKTTTVSFGETFGTTPQVMTAVNTVNGTAPVEGQARSVTTTDFVGAICQQDALDSCNDSHVTETVGWVAIEPGNEPFNEQVEANSTGNAVSNSAWTSQTFASAFSDTPVIVVETQTNDGGQDALVDEARNITATGAEVRYCEMDSGDTCDTHASEDVGWLAVERGVLTTGNIPAHPNLDRKYAKNGAYEFDGVDDYINSPYQDVATRTGTYSVSMWFKSTGATEQSLWQNSGSCSDRNGMQTNGTGWVGFGYYDGSTYTRASGPIDSGQWNHVVGVNNGGTLTIYVNGTEYSGTDGGYIHCSNNYMYTGRTSNPSAPRFFEGRVDDVRLYDRTLSSDEVSALHDSYDSSEVQVASTQKNLVSHWKLDGNGSDATPYSNHGTVNGATPTTDRHGQSNSAYDFDGTDDDISGISQPETQTNPNLFTASGFINPGNQDSFFVTPQSNGRDQFIAYDASNERLRVNVAESANTNTRARYSSTGSVPLSTWTHWAVAINGTTIKVYINGQLDQEFNESISIAGWNNEWRIGQRGNGTMWLLGKLDDIRVYGRELAPSEISDLHDSYNPEVQITDLSKKLKGHWTLNGDAKDKTPYSNHGVLEGGPALTADRHGRTDSAYEFDGAGGYMKVPVFNAKHGSLSFFFAPQDAGGTGQWGSRFDVISKGSGQGSRFLLYRANSTTLSFYYYTDASTHTVNFDTSSWAADDYRHIVIQFSDGDNDGKIQAFVDGQLQGETAVSGAIADGNELFMMSDRGVQHFTAGKLDDVRLYDRTLSETEIKMLYETYR